MRPKQDSKTADKRNHRRTSLKNKLKNKLKNREIIINSREIIINTMLFHFKTSLKVLSKIKMIETVKIFSLFKSIGLKILRI